MVTKTRKRKNSGSKRFIGKPSGRIQERVQRVGPERFGIVSVDCAKRRSKWMLCNFYGKVLVEPTDVEHTSGSLRAMTEFVRAASEAEGLKDILIAVEMTGIYHRPVQRAFRKSGFDTRTVHPFASSHYRQPLHPDVKTDDHDLEAIFHAAINGYGLASFPVSEVYRSLQASSRHRQNLVKQRARLQIQIRRLLHQTMPGFTDLFDDKLFLSCVAIPIAVAFASSTAISEAGVQGITNYLKDQKLRFHKRTVEKVIAWSSMAAERSELSVMQTRQWQQLNEVRKLMSQKIIETEREMAEFLVQTPYVLLLSVTGINVVSAARLGGEAGPIEHYATARAINGRAGLYPSRYQSDEVDHDGSLVRQCNRRLRSAAILIAENLIKCHPYYRGLSAVWTARKVDPRDRRCRVANRAMRMVFQLVGGNQVWRGKGVDRQHVLSKLQEFHHDHKSSMEVTIRDLNQAFQWLPKATYASEAQPLQTLARRKRRGPISMREILLPLLIRLGVNSENDVESNTSEARGTN